MKILFVLADFIIIFYNLIDRLQKLLVTFMISGFSIAELVIFRQRLLLLKLYESEVD